MKRINFLISLVALLAMVQFTSCGKGGNSPVDQYVEIIQDTTKKVKELNSININDMQTLLSPEAAKKLSEENADYELTDKDKSKLKKACGDLVKAVYDKVLEYNDEVPEALKSQLKSQKDMVVAAIDQLIDNSKTLGEIDGR